MDYDPHGYRSLHKDIYATFHPLVPKATKSTSIDSYALLFTEFVYYQNLGEFFLVSDFNAQTTFGQGQDLHLDDNGINLLEFPRPHR
jgi:hypothetical protein